MLYIFKHPLQFVAISMILLLLTIPVAHILAATPVTTDSRIKTYVYSENEVFRLVLNHGFQSSIEFGKNESIETISIGDTFTWKLTPVNNRLFIKQLKKKAFTNMTVITNKHIYQFDLIGRPNDGKFDKELAYLTRFYYPEGNFDSLNVSLPNPKAEHMRKAINDAKLTAPKSLAPFAPKISTPVNNHQFSTHSIAPSTQSAPSVLTAPTLSRQLNSFKQPLSTPTPAPITPAVPQLIKPPVNQTPIQNNLRLSPPTAPPILPNKSDNTSALPTVKPKISKLSNITDQRLTTTNDKQPQHLPKYNYNYSLEGPASIAPLMVFDDGKNTYFSFPNANSIPPTIAVVTGSNKERTLESFKRGNFTAVAAKARKFSIRTKNNVVFVYNEALGG